MKRITILSVISALLAFSCATVRWVSTPVLEQKNIKVSLEQRQEGSIVTEQKFNHPYKISSDELAGILTDLVYVEKAGMVKEIFKDHKQESVFLADEVNRLAPPISSALASATADQRVRFQSINKGGGLILASRRVTEGVAFIDSSGFLNIAFNVINYELDADARDEVPAEFMSRDPLEVKDSWTALIPTKSYAHLQQLKNDKDSPVWILVDLKKAQDVSASKAPAPPAVEKPEIKAQPVTSNAVETKINAEQTVQPSDNGTEKIKSNLQLLKELFESGLISEKEYEAKKKEILQDIK